MNKWIKKAIFGIVIGVPALAITIQSINWTWPTNQEVELALSNNVDINNIENISTLFFENMMTNAGSKQDQEILAAQWSIGSEVPSILAAILKPYLIFRLSAYDYDCYNYDDVVKNITFSSATIIGNPGDDIDGPVLRVNFKYGFTGSVAIQVGNLNKVSDEK